MQKDNLKRIKLNMLNDVIGKAEEAKNVLVEMIDNHMIEEYEASIAFSRLENFQDDIETIKSDVESK